MSRSTSLRVCNAVLLSSTQRIAEGIVTNSLFRYRQQQPRLAPAIVALQRRKRLLFRSGESSPRSLKFRAARA